MKQLKQTFFVIAFICISVNIVNAQSTIAVWDFDPLTGGSNNFGPSPYGATTTSSNVTVGGLTRGSGVGTTSGSGAANAWGGNDCMNTSLSNAISGNDFITFTLTGNTGYMLSISGIAAYNVRRSNTGPTTGQWQYQVGSGSFTNIGSAITWGTITNSAGNPQTAIDLSGISALQDVPSGTTITFRLVIWGGTGSSGTWYLNDPSGTSGDDFIIQGTTPLPVKLSLFNSNVKTNNIFLNWITSEEENNSGFDIERKRVNGEWKKIGFVHGNGTKNSESYYSFEDRNLATGKYHYRLKQIDYNGNYEYFDLEGIVEVGVPSKFNLSQNYPNPFNPVTKINYDLPVSGLVTLTIYDILGKEVTTIVNEFKEAGYYSVSFDASELTSGVYFYKLVSGNNSAVKKLVVLK